VKRRIVLCKVKEKELAVLIFQVWKPQKDITRSKTKEIKVLK